MKIDDKVRLKKSIYDDGEDHHPPGYIAMIDDIVVIRKVKENDILEVSHEGILDSSFLIYDGEYELMTERNGL